MATVILVRHGRTSANATGMLAGRLAGIRLDETGRAQAAKAGERLAPVRLAAVVTSPLERCRETAAEITRARTEPMKARSDKGLNECDYGEWQGRGLKELMREKIWATVQKQPSAVSFPGGESMHAMAARAAQAVRRLDEAVESEHGAAAVWVAVSHGDIIKAVLADALGMHLDLFQRIAVDPASISVIRYTPSRPYVLGMNTHDGDLAWLNPKPSRKKPRRRTTEAPVGGGAGPSADE